MMTIQHLLVTAVVAIGLLPQSPGAVIADESERKLEPISLSALAAKADLVAIAQVRDTDYTFTRAFPSEGSAFLRTLISYKTGRADEDLFEVYEKGLHPSECYFENPTVFEEGRRFLVFLRQNPDDPESYRGLDEGCALEVLVTSDNRYALKYPVTGIDLSDDLDALVTKLEYRDQYAVINEENLNPADRDKLLARKLIIPYQGNFKYTHGIDLTAARSQISADALKPNR